MKVSSRIGGWLAGLVVIALSSCASISFDRETPTSGTFEASALAFTLLSVDMPGPALQVCLENASDAMRPNTVPEEKFVFPYLGWFDFLLEIVGVRYATISGTWGYPPPAATTDADATPQSSPGS